MKKEMLIELKDKIEKLGKRRIGAGVLAGMIAASTPAMGISETTDLDKEEDYSIEEFMTSETNRTDEEILEASITDEEIYHLNLGGFVPVSQEKKVNPVGIESYFTGVSYATDHVLQRFDIVNEESKKELIQRMECLYFLATYDYITEDIEQKLVNGVNINGNVYRVLYSTDTSNNENYSFENFELAKELMNQIINYNNNQIRVTDNIDDLIDYSIFCYNENDRQIMKSMMKHWFLMHKNNTFDKDIFTEVFKELTTLNSVENKFNASDMGFGARWVAQFGIGHNVMEAIRDYLREHYSNEQLLKYFTKESLQAKEDGKENIWVIRDDVYLDLQCLNDDLEFWVFNYGQLYKFCVIDVDNDITRSFQRSNEAVEENDCDEAVEENDCDEVVEKNDCEATCKTCKEQLSVEEYFKGVNTSMDIVKEYLKSNSTATKKNLLEQIQCLYFLNNCVAARDIEEELLNGVNINGEIVYPIYETDMTQIADMSGIQNFKKANDFLNDRADYNQSMVVKTNDINKIIDLSIFCYDEEEKEYVRYLVELWFESHKGNTYNWDAFNTLFNNLVDIHKSTLSVGVKWMVLTGIGNDAIQVLRDYMLKNYSTKQLSKYFDTQLLNMGQFYLKNGVNPRENSTDELEVIVYKFKELWRVCYNESCNEIFEYFGQSCKEKTK